MYVGGVEGLHGVYVGECVEGIQGVYVGVVVGLHGENIVYM